MKRLLRPLITAVTVLAAGHAQAEILITEWMYNGLGTGNIGEFVELTNRGAAAVDFTGWSFDDDSRAAGTFSLSGFGLVAPGESVVLTDNTAAAFRTNWGLAAAAKVIGGSTTNLGRNDEINIFDGGGLLVDRLTYGDEAIPGSIRTQNKSGVPISLAALGTNNALLWKFAVEDLLGADLSAAGEVGSPGYFAVPEPASALLMTAAAGFIVRSARRRTCWG